MANNQFIDTARITVRAGDGGGGAVARQINGIFDLFLVFHKINEF